jgi:predicted dehydrogenase
MASPNQLRLGIIGCGAIAEFAYLPAARHLGDGQIVALADKNIARAKNLGERFGINNVVDDYHMLPKDLDGVIIALPHDLHAPVASEFLSQGVAVLVEKPLALTLAEAKKVIELAHEKRTLLQVGQIYRFCHRARMVKRALEEGWLGNLKSFSLEGNFADANPMASGFAWDKKRSGGGTLVDVGSLILDLLIWWFGQATIVEYRDDSRGGVECDCEIVLQFQSGHGTVSGKVILSRLRKLRDIVRIDGDKLSIVYGFETLQGLLELIPADPAWQVPFVLDDRSVPVQTSVDFFVEQLKNFVAAIRNPAISAAPADIVTPSLALMEECYRVRQPLTMPWESETAPALQYA